MTPNALRLTVGIIFLMHAIIVLCMHLYVVEEKAASLGFGVLGRPVTADGVSEKRRINRNTI